MRWRWLCINGLQFLVFFLQYFSVPDFPMCVFFRLLSMLRTPIRRSLSSKLLAILDISGCFLWIFYPQNYRIPHISLFTEDLNVQPILLQANAFLCYRILMFEWWINRNEMFKNTLPRNKLRNNLDFKFDLNNVSSCKMDLQDYYY